MRVTWIPSARADVVRARQYIERHDPGGAHRVSLAIRAAVRRIAEAPDLGRAGRVARTRELVVPCTPYIVAYSVVADRLIVLGVIHEAQDWPEQFA